VVTVGYTVGIEPHWVQIVERTLPIAGLPVELRGTHLVQISDLHVGPRVDDEYLVETFGRVDELRPDILVITGDFLTYRHERGDAQFDQLRAVLSHLPQGRWATLGILGNHDYGRGWSEPEVATRVVREAERAGVLVLRNAASNVRGLDVVGIDDLWGRKADPARALAARSADAAIVLCHNPDALDELPWDGYRGWVLAGHTHGGQCKPPFLPPPVLPVRNKRYSAGEISLADGRRLYINRGLGHLVRARFNVRPEITVFTLETSRP
jgi:uncharacterized protein